MLITFKSKASADVVMYKEHAKPILDLLNKNVDQGIVTAAEAAHAISVLETNMAESRKREVAEDTAPDTDDDPYELADRATKAAAFVSFSTRAYPLLEMLRAARDQQRDVIWGV